MSKPLHIVIAGATSAIANDCARLYAKEGASLTLIARDQEKLELCKKDLMARGALAVHTIVADFSQAEISQGFIEKIEHPIHTLIVAHGVLGNQEQLIQDSKARQLYFQTNTLSVIDLVSRLIPCFKAQKFGQIAIISSVAGDRGRQSNFYYGSSKAALSCFSSGLRNLLYPYGVHVMTVIPGFVASPMTAHLEQGPLFASSRKVAEDIVRGLQRKRNVLYTPFFWALIMLVIRSLPEILFKRLKL